jgi:hypothetical protein
MSVRQAIEGLFPFDGFLMITHKHNFHDIKKRDFWLENYVRTKPKVPERSWISSSYLSRDDMNSSYAGFEGSEHRWLVIESDRGSLEQQFWIHKRLARHYGNLGCICYSGGRSLHGFYFVEGWNAEERFELFAEAISLGVNDINSWRICQPCRLPGAWNRKTGRKQQIYVWNL